MKTVIALYDDFSTAQNVVQALVDAGIDRDQINVVANDAAREYADYDVHDEDDVSAGEGAAVGAVGGGVLGLLAGLGALAIPGVGPVVAAGPILGALTGAGVGAVTGGIVAALVDLGVPEEDAEYYAEGIRRGGTLVTARVADNRANEAVTIMNRYNPVDIDRSAQEWRAAGWSGWDADAEPYAHTDIDRERDFYLYESEVDTDYDTETDYDVDTDFEEREVERDVEGQMTVPVVEEELKVGKRRVRGGGVRLHTHREEIPVEEEVTLREERVHVERRPVNRAVADDELDDELDTFEEGTIEMTEMVEEAVVEKEARVIEEVVISKDVETHTETIRDTVTRTDVDVEEMDADLEVDYDYATFDSYDADFREHYDDAYPNARYSYEQARPAYRYGYTLATDARYRDRDWNEVEPEARRYWEERNEGTWEEFKESVRHAWYTTKQEVREHV